MPMSPPGHSHVKEICERIATSFGLLSWRWLCERRASWMTKSPDELDGHSLPENLLQSPTRSAIMAFQCDGLQLHIKAPFHNSSSRDLSEHPSTAGHVDIKLASLRENPCSRCCHSRGLPARMNMNLSEFSRRHPDPLGPSRKSCVMI